MPKQKKIPLRMCVSCREYKPKKELLRIVKNNQGEIFLDKTSKASGRGAYICNKLECIEKCRKTKMLNKVFSCEIPTSVYDKIKEDFLGDKQD